MALAKLYPNGVDDFVGNVDYRTTACCLGGAEQLGRYRLLCCVMLFTLQQKENDTLSSWRPWSLVSCWIPQDGEVRMRPDRARRNSLMNSRLSSSAGRLCPGSFHPIHFLLRCKCLNRRGGTARLTWHRAGPRRYTPRVDKLFVLFATQPTLVLSCPSF